MGRSLSGRVRLAAGLWLGLLVFAVLAGWLGVAQAAPPIPPAPTSQVTDGANVLSPELRLALARRLARYSSEGGHQIVVWIGTSSELPIEDLAVEAFEQWKIGDAKFDDGLALFVLVEDRTLRIEVGYGLEPTITDLVASQVIRTVMVPRIRAGDWDGAIVGGVEALVDTIEGSPGSLPADPEGKAIEDAPRGGMGWVQMIGIALAAIAFLVLLATRPQLALQLLFIFGRGLGGGGHRGGGGGGFSGGGGMSGGGGATGRW